MTNNTTPEWVEISAKEGPTKGHPDGRNLTYRFTNFDKELFEAAMDYLEETRVKLLNHPK